MSDTNGFSGTSARKYFPEMAVFELEKLAVMLSKLRTWPNPSISVAHAYLYAYSTVFWTGDQPEVCLFSTSWRLRVADLALTKLSIPMPLSSES